MAAAVTILLSTSNAVNSASWTPLLDVSRVALTTGCNVFTLGYAASTSSTGSVYAAKQSVQLVALDGA